MRWGVSTGLFAISTLATPLVALALLSPVNFGVFSATYIFYSVANMLISVTVCEPWSRLNAGSKIDSETTPNGYFETAAVISVVGFAIVALASFALTNSALQSVVAGLATAGGGYRVACRYFCVGRARVNITARADGVSVIMQLASLVAGLLLVGPVLAVYISWLLGSIGGLFGIAHGFPLRGMLRRGIGWIRQHCRTTVGLLGDSGVVSVKDVVLMLVLLPLLGAGGYGVFAH